MHILSWALFQIFQNTKYVKATFQRREADKYATIRNGLEVGIKKQDENVEEAVSPSVGEPFRGVHAW